MGVVAVGAGPAVMITAPGGNAVCAVAVAPDAAGLAKVGCAPQRFRRDDETLGTQLVDPEIPARTKMHPRLSTYCDPVKEAGGNSAGS